MSLNLFVVVLVTKREKITAWVTLSEIVLAKRLIMKASSVLTLLTFDSLLSFISEVSSLNYSSSSFSCSLARFLTQPLVSLVQSFEPRVFSLVSPLYSTLCQNNVVNYLGILCSTSDIVSYFALLLG